MKKYDLFIDSLLKKICEIRPTFTETDIKIASYLKDNYKKVCFMNLEKISKTLDVSQENIEIYFNIMGFENYEKFRKLLRKIVTSELKTVDRYEISMEINPTINSTLHDCINKEIQNLNTLVRTFDEKTFEIILREIMNATEIIVVGTLASSAIVIYAELILNKIGKRTTKIISSSSCNFNILSKFDRNTLVIAFGFARYPKETINVLRFFKEKNFNIISITDNKLSPLVRFSNYSLIVPSESISFTDFFAVQICIINTLAIWISKLDKNTTLSYLNEFENIAKNMGFYF